MSPHLRMPRTTATRIATGSSILRRRALSAAAEWIAASPTRTGARWWHRIQWGRIGRILLLAGGGYVVWRIVRAWPWTMWPLTGWWCWAAWRAGREAVSAAVEEEPEPAPEEDPRGDHAILLDALLDAIGTDRGIHLADLYSALRERPALAHLTDPHLRSLLDRHEVPVRRSIRARGVAGRTGVYRADIEALLAPPSPAESDPLSSHGDAGQSTFSPPLSTPGERLESVPQPAV